MRAIARALCAALAGGFLLILTSSAGSPASAAPAPDSAYTAVTPCVVFDSRVTQGAGGSFLGPINGGQAVTYLVEQLFPAGQGGGNTDCGIPKEANAVEINVVAVNALNEGNLKVTDGSPVSSGGLVNYNNLTPKLNTANAVIVPVDEEGQLVVTPNCGAGCTADSTDIRGVVLGYFTDELAVRTTATEVEVAQLQVEVAQLQALLADVTRIPSGVGGHDTLQFSGMNVQLVDGTGSTVCSDGTGGTFDSNCNGQGNLIVGYAENPHGYARTGSHNIVGGLDNAWSSYGGAVLGQNNTITNDYATVTAGYGNSALEPGASVSGGAESSASGSMSSISGGSKQSASGSRSAVSGGVSNVASGVSSSVTGGAFNSASAVQATVSGGNVRNAADTDDWVGGGLTQNS